MRGGMGGFRLLLRLAFAAVLGVVIGGERLAPPHTSERTPCEFFEWASDTHMQGFQRTDMYKDSWRRLCASRVVCQFAKSQLKAWPLLQACSLRSLLSQRSTFCKMEVSLLPFNDPDSSSLLTNSRTLLSPYIFTSEWRLLTPSCARGFSLTPEAFKCL